MSSKTKKLGSLADIYQAEHLDGTITRIRLDRIRPSEDQPRQDRKHAVEELAASIQRDGLLSPLVVTKDGEGFRIIAGERRYHALRHLKKADAECRIISREERDYWRIAIVENLQRENLTPAEEAQALQKLKKQESLSDADLAALVGKSRNYITEILGIAQLPEEAVREARTLGIDNKNFLIQVVQAHRKGNLEPFLDAYRGGQIRTVRDARAFNQGDTAAGSSREPTEQKKQGREREPAPKPTLKLTGSTLKIECGTPEAARKVRDWFRRNYR